MDFIKLIRSVEELLYEVMAWLVFYPRTMWRILAQPASMARYVEDEQKDAAEEQYTDTLSPPLLLMLTILIAHGVELGIGAKMIQAKTAVAQAILGSEQNLLILRSLLFAIFPLVVGDDARPAARAAARPDDAARPLLRAVLPRGAVRARRLGRRSARAPPAPHDAVRRPRPARSRTGLVRRRRDVVVRAPPGARPRPGASASRSAAFSAPRCTPPCSARASSWSSSEPRVAAAVRSRRLH